jgi:hypothetical protein
MRRGTMAMEIAHAPPQVLHAPTEDAQRERTMGVAVPAARP